MKRGKSRSFAYVARYVKGKAREAESSPPKCSRRNNMSLEVGCGSNLHPRPKIKIEIHYCHNTGETST